MSAQLTFRRGLFTFTGGAGAGLFALLCGACGQQTTTAQLRALEPSGEASVICLAKDESGAFTRGVDRALCPDYSDATDSPEQRHLHVLVTQPARGEVALVDLGAAIGQEVIDAEPTQPGYSFLPVGSEPGAIVSTAGGVASFVGVREPGREGIFGLPSSCVGPRPTGSPLRDIRAWPACRLPAAPGPMLILNDPAIDDDGDPSTPPRVRTSCDSGYVEPDALIGTAAAASRDYCPADLSSEQRPLGRRKLVVALPSLSELWILDAQELLDREPGSFDACTPERQVLLQVETDALSERIPADLTPSSASCAPVGFNHGPPADARPWPADFALDDEQRLYVADSQAPIIHVLDANDPCTLAALPALHPLSYTDPNAVVTTRRIAVSDLTPGGKRFAYAVDNSASPTAGSLMAFDVSPGSTERTPIVREHSTYNPGEAPDRILLSHDVADVKFVFQDYPNPDINTNIAVEGIACDPNPSISITSPAALYRPSSDLTTGAAPSKLRGTFAIAALHSGQVQIIDVEDLDAPCRRPVSVNVKATEDLFGCKNDDPSVEATGYELGGINTVSDELSCNLVAPHRARSRGFFSNSVGAATSAGLLSFPTLTLDTGRSVLTDQSDEGRAQPKLLGVPYASAEPASVYVGPLRYSTDDPAIPLQLDPARAQTSSLLLSYQEPRAFNPNEAYSAIYEGVVRSNSEALFSVDPATSLGTLTGGLNASFCSSGIRDLDLAAEDGRNLGVNAPDLTAFERRHGDYAQITQPLLDVDDPYWVVGGPGAECGAELFAIDASTPAARQGRDLCEQFFGPAEVPTSERDFRIVQASEDRLSIEPRSWDPSSSSENRRLQLLQFASCCFPGPSTFQVRGGHQWVVRGSVSGVSHHVIADPATGRCVNDCSPLTQRLAGRVFEISCSDKCPQDPQNGPAVGPAVRNEDFACIVDDTTGGIEPGKPGSECIFQSLTSRFAIYRGQGPSTRDMAFRWQLSDGFQPLALALTTTDRARSAPHSMVNLPELGEILITDTSAPGLTFVAVASTALTTTSVY